MRKSVKAKEKSKNYCCFDIWCYNLELRFPCFPEGICKKVRKIFKKIQALRLSQVFFMKYFFIVCELFSISFSYLGVMWVICGGVQIGKGANMRKISGNHAGGQISRELQKCNSSWSSVNISLYNVFFENICDLKESQLLIRIHKMHDVKT